MLSFFPRGVLDEILNLIESVSEDFPFYSSIAISLSLSPNYLSDMTEILLRRTSNRKLSSSLSTTMQCQVALSLVGSV